MRLGRARLYDVDEAGRSLQASSVLLMLLLVLSAASAIQPANEKRMMARG